MESSSQLISEEILIHVKSQLDQIFDYIQTLGYQKGKDWDITVSNISDVNYLSISKSAELSQPSSIQCTISASVITNQSIPEWIVGINLSPFNKFLKLYTVFGSSDLRVVMANFHPQLDQSFTNFLHSEKMDELDRNIDASVRGWIHVLSHELHQDITGTNLRPGPPKIIDEYW